MRCYLLIFCVFVLADVVCISAQEQGQKPQTITTSPKEITVLLKFEGSKAVKVKGTAVFAPTQANPDDTLTGELVCTIAESDRQRIAQNLIRPLSAIPGSVSLKEVQAVFEKHAECPDLRFEFAPIKTAIRGVEVNSDHFVLSFVKTDQELSQLFCRWARNILGGRANPICPCKRINALLKGEKLEQ